jgi:hypothetical protein
MNDWQIKEITMDYSSLRWQKQLFLLQEAPKECNEATVPTDVPDDIKAECGDLEVVYVKSVDCPKGITTLLYWL